MAVTNPDPAAQPGTPMTAGMAVTTAVRRRRNDSARPVWMEEPSLPLKVLKAVTLAFIVLVMTFPLVYVIAVSFSSAKDVLGGGLVLFPANPTLDAYRAIFEGGVVTRALRVSVGLPAEGDVFLAAVKETLG